MQPRHQSGKTYTAYTMGSFYQHGLSLIPEWINYYIHYKVWDEIIYLYPNFNSAAEV